MYVCLHVWMYVCVCVWMYVCTYVYVCMYVCMYVCTCMYVCVYVCMHHVEALAWTLRVSLLDTSWPASRGKLSWFAHMHKKQPKNQDAFRWNENLCIMHLLSRAKEESCNFFTCKFTHLGPRPCLCRQSLSLKQHSSKNTNWSVLYPASCIFCANSIRRSSLLRINTGDDLLGISQPDEKPMEGRWIHRVL